MTKKEYEDITRKINEVKKKYEGEVDYPACDSYENGFADGVLEGLVQAEYIIDKCRREYRKEK